MFASGGDKFHIAFNTAMPDTSGYHLYAIRRVFESSSRVVWCCVVLCCVGVVIIIIIIININIDERQ